MGILVYIQSHELMTSVDTTSYENAWITSVKIWCTVEELAWTVTIAVTPCSIEVWLTWFKTCTWKVYDIIYLSCLTVTIHEEFLTIMGKVLTWDFLSVSVIILTETEFLSHAIVNDSNCSATCGSSHARIFLRISILCCGSVNHAINITQGHPIYRTTYRCRRRNACLNCNSSTCWRNPALTAVISPWGSILAIGTDSINWAVRHVYAWTLLKTHEYLCTTILVPVITYDILFIVLEVTHVWSAVDPPKHRTIKLRHLKQSMLVVPTINWKRVRHLLRVVVLHQQFHLAITVNIGSTGIIRNVSCLQLSRMLRYNLEVILCPYSLGSR